MRKPHLGSHLHWKQEGPGPSPSPALVDSRFLCSPSSPCSLFFLFLSRVTVTTDKWKEGHCRCCRGIPTRTALSSDLSRPGKANSRRTKAWPAVALSERGFRTCRWMCEGEHGAFVLPAWSPKVAGGTRHNGTSHETVEALELAQRWLTLALRVSRVAKVGGDGTRY